VPGGGRGRRRGIERQQTVCVGGFRDELLSDFDKKLMSSNITTAAAADLGPLMTFSAAGTASTGVLGIIWYYTLCLKKKQDTKLLPITFPNVNRFSKFFH